MNKTFRNSAIASILLLCTATHAQQSGDTITEETSNKSIEEVVVFAESQNDLAMSAFRSGDFETAQKGFLKNAKCALRRTRSLESLIDNQNLEIERARSAQTVQSTISSGGGSNSGASLGANGNSFNSGTRQNSKKLKDFTCENRGFQLYMVGLSQIQLDKQDEALENFKRATSINRLLYDAHYRIGLISILSNDLKESRKQLKKIDAILKKCKKKCTVKDEILMRQEHLSKSIEKAQG